MTKEQEQLVNETLEFSELQFLGSMLNHLHGEMQKLKTQKQDDFKVMLATDNIQKDNQEAIRAYNELFDTIRTRVTEKHGIELRSIKQIKNGKN